MPRPAVPSHMDSFDIAKQRVVRSMLAIAANMEIMCEQQAQQHQRVEARCSTEQWLDENEREWYAMDEMLRSRPWAQKRQEPFPYPFREATSRMRSVEGDWVGDDRDPSNRKWTRSEVVSCDVLVHFRPVAEHPPLRRIILFLPEFGSDKSFDSAAWKQLTPLDTCDIWLVSWQGWSDFDEMIDQVLHKVWSFADATSTVWFAHSTGAVVAYELLKRFERYQTPNLPVALVVSGCPAPHLFPEEYKLHEKHSWLDQLCTELDFEQLTEEQSAVLLREFQVVPTSEVDPVLFAAMKRGIVPPLINKKYDTMPAFTSAQKQAIINDLKVMRSYQFKHSSDSKAVLVPIVALCHDDDELVAPSTVKAWAEFSKSGADFDFCALQDYEDGEVLAEQGHGFTRRPPQTVLSKVLNTANKFQLAKELDKCLPDCGPTDGSIPEEIDCVVVGAGISGIMQAKALVETGKSVIVVDRYRTIGGIWMFYANTFSRVNSSEPAYRIVNQEGIGSRPNEDHSPRHDILRDIFTVANKYLYGMIRCNMDVTKVTKRPDNTYDLLIKSSRTGKLHKVHSNIVSFHVNRRIGRRRDITWPNSRSFRGDEVYGYANEVLGLNFWGKRVVIVGAGAFAFENMRTALEHGAKHCTVLGRRSGTTCPKWIDMIAFLRPLDQYFNTQKSGNIISFDAWRQCYNDAGLRTPKCWEEGLLKPHNHTVSVSDLAFIGGFHGMVDLRVGEIKHFRLDGQGVELIDGTRLDADIVIKATGFHLNDAVPSITGYKQIHSFGLLDYNLNYGAEPLLDGGQFGGLKGRVESSNDGHVDESAMYTGVMEMRKLGLPDVTPRVNPFGSAYVGGMLTSAYTFKWLVEHKEYQRDLLDTVGPPVQSCVETWVSQIGVNTTRTIQKLLAKLG